MNRELRFRAWDGEKIVYNQFAISSYGEVHAYEPAREYFGFFPNSWKVMQWTGLLDSKGNEIYEGDILSFENQKSVVEYIGNGFWVKEGERNWMPSEHLCEIIGNIFENSDLLV